MDPSCWDQIHGGKRSQLPSSFSLSDCRTSCEFGGGAAGGGGILGDQQTQRAASSAFLVCWSENCDSDYHGLGIEILT